MKFSYMGSTLIEIFDVKVLYAIYHGIYKYQGNTVNYFFEIS